MKALTALFLLSLVLALIASLDAHAQSTASVTAPKFEMLAIPLAVLSILSIFAYLAAKNRN